VISKQQRFQPMKNLNVRLLSVMLLLLFLFGCRREDSSLHISLSPHVYDSEVARDWYDLTCTVIKETSGFYPTHAARALGYTGITLYETVVQGWHGAPRLAGQLQELHIASLPKADLINMEYNWAIAANAALAEIMRRLYQDNITSENKEAIELLEERWRAQLSQGVSSSIVNRSIKFGKDMAIAIYNYSQSDGGHLAYLDPFENNRPYTWPSIQGAWEPTGGPPAPLSPRWDQNRPFLPSSIINECQPYAHPEFSTSPRSEFYEQAYEVYTTVNNHTTEQRIIAEYWADDPFNTCTPAGHTVNIMTQLLEEHNANLAMAALGYAKLGIAESDVFIACWKSKYDYFLIRPVTYIRKYIDPAFKTLILTPPFPAYTSGHASEAAAGSRIFTEMFTKGDGAYNFTDRSQLRYGFAVRSYNNFNQVAEECANSRLYGGIHYDFDNQLGLSIGRAIGDAVNRRINWPKSEFGR